MDKKEDSKETSKEIKDSTDELKWTREHKMKELTEVSTMGKCPMCHIGDKYQIDDPDTPGKSQCKGCGTKYYDREKGGMLSQDE